jgi:septum formation protein
MLILASASPRRQELLRSAGISFTVQRADIDETPLFGESAQACAERLARQKALAVQLHYPRDYVLGADTIVVVDKIILGKPRDESDATRMLGLLSGRTHAVITGVCLTVPLAKSKQASTSEMEQLAAGNGQMVAGSEITLVTMFKVSDQEIRAYIATGEPMDKAGAYAIQGIASRWIPRIEGDYSNVVGLPVARVYAMLCQSGALPT